MSEAQISCPKCRAAIPPEAPQGLCPKCLLQQASFPTETGPTTRHSRPNPPDRDELAAAFPHLQILELIGQGGMGFVYKARQPKLDRLVALKILAQPLAEQTHFAERFTREGRTLAKLNHPNIVTIHDFGHAAPFFYLLMEYVDGVNLRQAMRAGAVNSSQALAIVPRICEALQYAHNEGVLHRDIKPDNILLDTRGRVKIADFGIAKLMAEAVAENPLTGSGASLGTPHYMAPEQIEKPNSVDHRADIYSLGVVFYEMLTGELPLGRFAAPSETSGNDPRLDEIVFQTLEKQPERRPQSADEVRTRVETISAGPQHAEPTEGQVAFKMSKCFLTTPQFLSTWIGRLLRYTNKGELRLDEDTLTFAPRGNWIVIPLRAITSLSMGDFPAGIGKLKFISVTFTEKGNTHRFFFVPTRGGFRSIWNTNELVEEWFNAIRHATKARTGRVPPSFKDDLDPLPSARKPQLLPTLAKFALILIAVPLFMLAASFGLYTLLRKPTQREPYNTLLPPPYIDPSAATADPDRTINITTVFSTNNAISLRTSTEPAADERFIPVIRYGDGPWGEADNVSVRQEYRRGPAGPSHESSFMWGLPTAFSSGYETAAAVLRTRAELSQRTLTIPLFTNTVAPIFSLTNSSGQSVHLGLRVQRSTLKPLAPPIVATVSGFRLQTIVQNKKSYLATAAYPDLPPGYRLQAIALLDGHEVEAKTEQQNDNFPNFVWNTWALPENYPGDISFGADRKIQLTYGEPLVVYSLNNDNYAARLELVPMPGITPPVVVPSVKHLNSKPEPPDAPPAETLELTLLRRSVEPRRIVMEVRGLVTLDQTFFAIVDFPTPDESRSSPRRIPQSISSVPMQSASFPGNPSENTSLWRKIRGATNSESGELMWHFGESFSLERDLTPAVDRFFEKRDSKNIRLTDGKRTPLFRMTNAFGHIAVCAMEFQTSPATVKDPSAGVIVTSFAGSTNESVIIGNLLVAFPEDADVQASGTVDGNPVTTILTRKLDRSGAIECRWPFPDGFLPPRENSSTNQTAARRSFTAPVVADHAASPIFERLNQRVRAGDARITSSEPLELFAITNAQGKILRGKIEISHGR
jgi:serine/threonine protein kinase